MWQLFIPVVLVSSLVIGVVVASAVRQVAATRRWATVAVIGIAASPVAIVLHNLLSAILGGEEVVSFIVALLVAPLFIAVGTLGVALALARDGRFAQVGIWLIVAGGGVALFALYALLAPAVTALAGGDPSIQAAIEVVVLPASATALATGAAAAAVTRLRLPATRSTSG
jgi:hypothetical protein